MAAARGFRPTLRGFLGRFYIAADEADGIYTPVDPDTPISPAGGFYVHLNPHLPASHVMLQTPPETEDSEPYHLLLVEFDDADVIDEGGRTRAIPHSPFYDAPDDPKISRRWAKISTGTIVDELSLSEIGTITNRFAYNQADDVSAILDAHGWAAWTPDLV